MPYTYLIGWTAHNKWYYGVRYSEKSNDDDLWESYFTSSKYVHEYVEKWGNPDYIKIRVKFKSPKQAIRCEDRVIQKLQLYKKETFLNKAYSGAIYYDEDVRRKISESAKKPRSEAFREARSKAMKKLWNDGVYNNRPPQTKEHILNVSLALKEKWKNQEHHSKGTIRSEEAKQKTSCTLLNNYASMSIEERKVKHGHPGESNGMFGKSHKSEVKQKIKQAALNRPKFACEHCNKQVTKQSYGRYHVDGKCVSAY